MRESKEPVERQEESIDSLPNSFFRATYGCGFELSAGFLLEPNIPKTLPRKPFFFSVVSGGVCPELASGFAAFGGTEAEAEPGCGGFPFLPKRCESQVPGFCAKCPPCNSHNCVGSLPETKYSVTVCGLAALRIDGFLDHTGRRSERLGVAVPWQRHGTLHEFGPDRRRRLTARELEIAVVVKTNPYDAQQIRGKAREPSIARGSGLARRRSREPHRADSDTGAAIDDVLHEAGYQIGDAWVEYGACARSGRFFHAAIS